MSSKPIYPRSPKDYSGPKVKDTQTFIQKAQFVHGDHYEYEKTEYVNAKSKITITCPIHGDFEQSPNVHLKGHGCRECQYDSQKSNTENFIQKANVIHDDKYSYEKTEYSGALTKVIITCPIHGDFEQTSSNHLNGSGCPSCKNESLSGGYTNNKEEYKEQPAILYHIRFTVKETDESFEKIGITVNSVKDRFNITKDHDLELEVINEYPTTLYEAIELEQEIKEYLIENDLAYRVHTLKQYPRVGGWTECFRCGDLDSVFKG